MYKPNNIPAKDVVAGVIDKMKAKNKPRLTQQRFLKKTAQDLEEIKARIDFLGEAVMESTTPEQILLSHGISPEQAQETLARYARALRTDRRRPNLILDTCSTQIEEMKDRLVTEFRQQLDAILKEDKNV